MSPADEVGWDDVVCVAPNQVSSPVGGEVAILGLDQGVYYGLNSTGARIWELLQQPAQVGHIHATLVEEYEIDAETLRHDLLGILGQLRAQGLVEVRREDTA